MDSTIKLSSAQIQRVLSLAAGEDIPEPTTLLGRFSVELESRYAVLTLSLQNVVLVPSQENGVLAYEH